MELIKSSDNLVKPFYYLKGTVRYHMNKHFKYVCRISILEIMISDFS